MIEVTEEEMAQIERLRDVLSAGGKNVTHKEALIKAAEDCLEKRDPMRKAERAARRQEKKSLEKMQLEKKSQENKREAERAEGGFPPGQNSEPRDSEPRDTESQNMDSKNTVSEHPPTAFGTGDKGRRPIPSQSQHNWVFVPRISRESRR